MRPQTDKMDLRKERREGVSKKGVWGITAARVSYDQLLSIVPDLEMLGLGRFQTGLRRIYDDGRW